MSHHHNRQSVSTTDTDQCGLENPAYLEKRQSQEPKVNGETKLGADTGICSRQHNRRNDKRCPSYCAPFFLGCMLFAATIIILLLIFDVIQVDNSQMCLSAECVRRSALIIKGLNSSVDPCEDFEAYACGGWNHRVRIPPGSDEINNLKILERKTLLFFRDEFDSPTSATDDVTVKKMKILYSSCMNIVFRDLIEYNHSHQVAKKYFPKGDMNFSSSYGDLGAADVGTFLGILTNMGIHPLFITESTPDFGRGLYVLRIRPPILDGIGRNIKLVNETIVKSGVYTKQFDVLQQLFKQYGVNFTEIDVEAILRFSCKLSEIVGLTANMNDKMLVNLTEIAKITSAQIDFRKYLIKILASSYPGNINITVISQPSYFRELNKLLNATDKGVVYNYLVTSYLIGSLPYLHSDAIELYRKLFPSTKELWEFCVEKTRTLFSSGASALYVKKQLKNKVQVKRQLDDLIIRIRNGFGENLLKLRWIDEQTRNIASSKLSTMGTYAAYPDDLLNATRVADIYNKVNLKFTHFYTNVITATNAMQRRSFSLIVKSNSLKWPLPIYSANAAYLAVTNEFHIYSGLLDAPFFSENLPNYITYGSIGLSIGHEITHGFDEQGRYFGNTGARKMWWTNESSTAFDKKARCFVDQYDRFDVPNPADKSKRLPVNGTRTLGETIADSGGVHATRTAYVKWLTETNAGKKEPMLPGFESSMTQDRLNFISMAQIYCGKATSVGTSRITKRAHGHPITRIYSMVMNNEEFASVFKCKVGSPMNPEHKCSLW
ncbi:endothelin-converting enzyme 1-like isoform X2 [Tubulanus polymorphus]|uniref:endothelin-converting enzyme 1-like isoform X2 n=1 Tax=Tubulanus polymorphus TaxID=672921 RepID=UPI003DA6BDE5